MCAVILVVIALFVVAAVGVLVETIVRMGLVLESVGLWFHGWVVSHLKIYDICAQYNPG